MPGTLDRSLAPISVTDLADRAALGEPEAGVRANAGVVDTYPGPSLKLGRRAIYTHRQAQRPRGTGPRFRELSDRSGRSFRYT